MDSEDDSEARKNIVSDDFVGQKVSNAIAFYHSFIIVKVRIEKNDLKPVKKNT